MKKKKLKFLSAIAALLGLTAAAGATSGVAWFTAANTVSVSGMSIQAAVENGIVIANEDHTADSNWVTSVNASHQNAGLTKLIPASTADLATWYHGLSDKADDGQSNVVYTQFTDFTNDDGIYSAKAGDQVASAKPVYLLNKFYIQASASADIPGQDIYLKTLTVDQTDTTDKLSPSLRIGFGYKLPGGSFTKANIFAPVSGADLTYKVNNTTDVTALASGADVELIDGVDIKAYTTAGTNAIEFSVFMYFEGEDANHKSANIGALDALTVGFSLENKTHA